MKMQLNVSTIALLLTRPQYLFTGGNINAMQLGRMIHEKVYPMRQNRLSKVIDNVEIVGYADNIHDGMVEELKIFNGKYKEQHVRYASIQANIYCYLAGVKSYRIRLFDVTTLSEDKIEMMADYTRALEDILMAIAIRKRLNELLGIK
jgi:hypothetical protein